MNDPLEQLQRLAELRDSGIISPDEFQAKKAELLNLVGQASKTATRATAVAASAQHFPPPIPTKTGNDGYTSQLTGLPASASQLEVDVALNRVQEAEQQLHHLYDDLNSYRRRYWITAVQLYYVAWVALCRIGTAQFNAWSVLAIASASVVIVTCLFAGYAILRATGLPIPVAATISFVASGAMGLHFFALPWTTWVSQRLFRLRAECSLKRELILQVKTKIPEAQRSVELLDQAYSRLMNILASTRHRLLATEWRLLRGIPFEQFLNEVFVELGYSVETTKTSGDQGIDLVLKGWDARIAVQVKGYADSIGNGAVQEAHTGMVHYKCQRCVVITNSNFTRSAQELARSVGCSLIDGSMIPDLIQGKIRL